jgi:hypothetical protein
VRRRQITVSHEAEDWWRAAAVHEMILNLNDERRRFA